MCSQLDKEKSITKKLEIMKDLEKQIKNHFEMVFIMVEKGRSILNDENKIELGFSFELSNHRNGEQMLDKINSLGLDRSMYSIDELPLGKLNIACKFYSDLNIQSLLRNTLNILLLTNEFDGFFGGFFVNTNSIK